MKRVITVQDDIATIMGGFAWLRGMRPGQQWSCALPHKHKGSEYRE